MVANYPRLVAHAQASNMCSFLVYNESTTLKTRNSLARMTDFDAGVALEVHNEVDGS